MATVTKKTSPPVPPPSSEPRAHWILRAFDATYRFLASLKLAVLTLSTLAATLAFATFFESWYGTGAVQEWIYQSKFFAILLAFLGINILCAALIRFPWTKRQTGFVITHTGLLIVLFGSFLSVNFGDEGQVRMLEGAPATEEVVRLNHPVIRVQKVEADGARREFAFPFYGGSFAWSDGRKETITDRRDPFQIAISHHIPAATPYLTKHEPDPSGRGVPMLRAALMIKPPNAPTATDWLGGEDGDNWLVVDSPRIGRATRDLGPALIAFQFVEGPNVAERVEDFLHPPKDPLRASVARIHYRDRSGKDRLFEWPVVEGEEGKSADLPDSDLNITFSKKVAPPVPAQLDPHWLSDPHQDEGMGSVPAVVFKVRKGDGPAIDHYGWCPWPMVPSVLGKDEPGAKELVRIGYFTPPTIAPEGAPVMQGRLGVIEVLATPDKKLYYRAFGRDEKDGRHGLRGVGPLVEGKTMPLFGNKGTMAISLRVDELLTSGKTREVCEPMPLSKQNLNDGIPACEVDLTTADGHTEHFWLRRTYDLETHYKTIHVPGGDVYRVAYDFGRKPLDFNLTLTDFEVGMDPGTDVPSSYTSEVLLNDEGRGVREKPVTVTMNEPMTHRGWTLYQSNYIPLKDGRGRKTGQFISVLQARYDPAWQVVYTGCLLVIAGTFVQFYMRAGIFTDGGKKERARAEARASKAAAKANGQPDKTPAAETQPEVLEPL